MVYMANCLSFIVHNTSNESSHRNDDHTLVVQELSGFVTEMLKKSGLFKQIAHIFNRLSYKLKGNLNYT